MYIGIRQLVISSSSLRLSRGFYAIFLFPFPLSDHFHVMGAIDTATVKRSKAQFRSRRSGSETPSTSAPSSFVRVVTLDAIMAQLQCMDARLDTLSTELYQVNIHVGRIAWRQVVMGGFAPEASSPPPPTASEAEVDGDDGDDDILPRMMMMEMLFRYWWDVYLTLLPFVTRDKKGE